MSTVKTTMHSKIRILALAGLLAAGAVIAAPGRAGAASYYGYVCVAGYTQSALTATGEDGYLSIGVYSGPDCTGAFVGAANFCSTGATGSSCATSLYLFRDGPLIALWQNAVRAIADAIRVNVITLSTCSTCGIHIDFIGTP